jgi:hypothetical protein
MRRHVKRNNSERWLAVPAESVYGVHVQRVCAALDK